MPSPSNITKNRPLNGAAKFRADLAAWSLWLVNVCRRAATSSVNWGRSSAGGSFAGGCVAAWYTVGFAHPLAARFGTSFPVLAGASAAAILALLAATMGAGRSGAAWQRRTILVCLFVAVWAISFGRLTDFAAAGYHSFSLELLSRRLVQFALAFATSLALLGVPIACATRLSLGTSTGRVVWILVGAACGLVVATQIVGPFLGTQWVLWIAAASGLIAVATRRRLDDSAQAQASGSTTVLWPLCGSLAVGIAAAALGRLTLQLAPSAEALEWTDWAGFLFGTAVALVLLQRAASDRRGLTVAWLLLAAAIGATLPVACFGTLTDWSLAETANVSQVGWLILIRAAFVTAVFLPLGFAWGSSSGSAAEMRLAKRRRGRCRRSWQVSSSRGGS